MELYVWQGDWGLPSIDRQCLAVMTYCRFAEVPVTFIKSNNPWKTRSGELPVLICDGEKITGVQRILSFFRQKEYSLDHNLSNKQSAEIVAYTALLEDKLLPALNQLWWADDQNYVELTRPWYAKALPLPLNFFLPNRYQGWAKGALQAKLEGCTDEQLEKEVYKDARECLNYLSTKLGNKKYFTGNSPSSLDAIIFGYLAPLLKAPFTNKVLQSHLLCCNNLVTFCQTILSSHFPLSPEELAALRKQEEEARKTRQATMAAEDFPNKRRDMLLAFSVAVTAMAGYAYLSGIIDITRVSKMSSTAAPM